MKNFYLRLISSLFIAPIFLYALYEASYFFYTIIFLISIISFYEINKNVKQIKTIFFLYLLIIFFAFSLINVRGSNFENYILCVWILFIVWTSDIGGYVVGKIFKGPKLSIYSPNKTIAGFIGSILFSQMSFFIPYFFLNSFVFTVKIILIQFLFCLFSVSGDIFFSLIKRINQIKDYSNVIPGHGGILDRIDGMIFVIIGYYFLRYFNVI